MWRVETGDTVTRHVRAAPRTLHTLRTGEPSSGRETESVSRRTRIRRDQLAKRRVYTACVRHCERAAQKAKIPNRRGRGPASCVRKTAAPSVVLSYTQRRTHYGPAHVDAQRVVCPSTLRLQRTLHSLLCRSGNLTKRTLEHLLELVVGDQHLWADPARAEDGSQLPAQGAAGASKHHRPVLSPRE